MTPADRDALLGAHPRSRALAAAWQGSAPYRAAHATLATADQNDADALAEAAATLLADDSWVAELITPLTAALHADPWFEPPLRVHRDGLRIAAVLVDTPAVSISATILSADALAATPPPPSVVVSGRVSVVRYARAGGAHLRRWHAGPVAPNFTAADAPPAAPLPGLPLRDGIVLRHDGRVEGHVIAGGTSDLATVTAAIRPGAAAVMREYSLPGGHLLRSAATDDAESRTQMLLTLLRVSGRADAAPVFAEASQAPAFPLRWAAMREWLALDTAAALPRLRAMTGDPHPEVRAAARATLPHAEALVACPA